MSVEFDERTRDEMGKWVDSAIIEGVSGIASLRRVLGASRKIVARVDELGLEERGNALLALVEIDELYLSEDDYIHIHNPSLVRKNPTSVKLFYLDLSSD